MRRIYESEALERDDSEPFSPRERDRDAQPRAIRWINTGAITRRIVPDWLRSRSISVSLSVPKTEFTVGERVPFLVTMKNAMPFAVTIATRSPVLWNWSVDGHEEASHVPTNHAPEEHRAFDFGRGERKQFRKTWNGMFRVSESEWERPAPGEYRLGAGLNVDDAAEKGLYDEQTIRLVPE